MSLYIQGDMRAFEVLYARHRPKVYGYLAKRLPSKQSADEVFQIAFMKLHQFRSKYKFGEPFLPWFFTIIKNAHFDYLRKTQSEKIKVEALKEQPSFASDAGEEILSDKLQEGISRLSDNQQKLIHSRYVDGMSFDEIAKDSNSTPEAVRQSVSRLTRKLKNLVRGRPS